MELMLERIEQRAGAHTHLYPLDLVLVPNAITVLLGATQNLDGVGGQSGGCRTVSIFAKCNKHKTTCRPVGGTWKPG